jgi:hypothetical protein
MFAKVCTALGFCDDEIMSFWEAKALLMYNMYVAIRILNASSLQQ